jgi:hypothetical protein
MPAPAGVLSQVLTGGNHTCHEWRLAAPEHLKSVSGIEHYRHRRDLEQGLAISQSALQWQTPNALGSERRRILHSLRAHWDNPR